MRTLALEINEIEQRQRLNRDSKSFSLYSDACWSQGTVATGLVGNLIHVTQRRRLTRYFRGVPKVMNLRATMYNIEVDLQSSIGKLFEQMFSDRRDSSGIQSTGCLFYKKHN
uniref:Uncharacterized protein n=1 Tax=Coccidioides posadasii RMSCC 3488 TaxID=454284 RepID=A0A0J6FVK6_COCPO|nr:hypothetical protein CPAG_09774 [Coccidioides posadasii RMSCC 3488]